jgi:hypothetical protein
VKGKHGAMTDVRGPKCGEFEGKVEAQGQLVDRLGRDKKLTDDMKGYEKAITDLKKELAGLGTETEAGKARLDPFPGFLLEMGFVSDKTARALTDNRPITDSLTMEAQAWFGAPASVGFIFWLFSLLVCDKTEAERRMVEVVKAAAEERAESVLAAAGQEGVTPTAPKPAADPEPDHHSPEAVLGIEGEELPAFAHAPETVAEATAAAILKADPHKTYGRKARGKPKEASKDSVRQWRKEMVINRPGCKNGSLRPSYEAWCEDMNVAPVNPTVFGRMLREEFGFEKTGSRGRACYLDVDLRPAALRAVS